jgi:hypothetical protein
VRCQIRSVVAANRDTVEVVADAAWVDCGGPDDMELKARVIFQNSRLPRFQGIRPDFIQVVDSSGSEIVRWDDAKEQAARALEEEDRRREEEELFRADRT